MGAGGKLSHPLATTPQIMLHARWELGRERSFILQGSEVLIAKAMAVNVLGWEAVGEGDKSPPTLVPATSLGRLRKTIIWGF